jgi:hypothetical protein
MREIKFRAWLEQDGGEMLYQDANTSSAMNGLAAFVHNVGQARGYTPKVMQYTGLKDRNGKEIYEGDVITDPYSPHNTIVMENTPKQWHDLIEYNAYHDIPHLSEVIGNIYENPELLDQKPQ